MPRKGGSKGRHKYRRFANTSVFERYGRKIAEAMDAEQRHGPVRTLSDMSDEEIASLERRTGCKVKR